MIFLKEKSKKNLLLMLLSFFSISCFSSKEKVKKVVKLQNEYLSVMAKSTGAELISILSLEDNTEYLWQGDTVTWSDHAIVQFPIIGNLKNNNYELDGKKYEMNSHGFARVSQFDILENTDDRVVFQLKSDESTHLVYPYEFTFQVTYVLEGKSVQIEFDVLNENEREMFFSLGYHPGFNCPFKLGEGMEDYYLKFSDIEFADRLVMKNNLINEVEPNYIDGSDTLHLSKSIFQKDAIILKDISSKSISLNNLKNDRSVTITFGDVPYLGIWSPKQFGDFVCIEPWFGIPDLENRSNNFKEKEGILRIGQKRSFDWKCLITIE